MIKRYLTMAAATMMLTSAAQAQHRPVPMLDVAGVRLGATPTEASTALRAAGYKVDTWATPSFEQAVTREAARRRAASLPWTKDAGVAKLIGDGPRLEHAEVRFLQTAAGPKVVEVTVLVPATSITAAAAKAQLIGKYGQPDAIRGLGSELNWCSAEVMKVCGVTLVLDGPQPNAYPILEATARDGMFIALRQGQLAEREAERAQEAAIERLTPKTKAAF